MKIGSIGYNYSHGKEFVMDRPGGNGAWLFLLIKTPAIFEIDGKEVNVKENSFVVFSPETPCKYRGLEDIYTDDWVYFDADEYDFVNLRKLKIPLNETMYIGNAEELSQIIHIMAYEHYSTELFHEEIERHYIDILFMKLSRIIQSHSCASSKLLAERNYKFTQLRTKIFTMPDCLPDIDGMAAEVGMIRSGFQHLYKKIFGISVMTDVISGRLDRAKRLLSSTNLTIKEIAERCGYESEYNFMRQFKGQTGKTPTEYRRCI